MEILTTVQLPVPVHRLGEVRQVQQRIGDELARPVKRHVAAALRLVDGCAGGSNLPLRREHVLRRRLQPAEREDWRMLQDEQRVATVFAPHFSGQGPLQGLRRAVANAAEAVQRDRCGRRAQAVEAAHVLARWRYLLVQPFYFWHAHRNNGQVHEHEASPTFFRPSRRVVRRFHSRRPLCRPLSDGTHGMSPRCTTCGVTAEASFSKRMLRGANAGRRCKSCVAAAEAAEQAAAAQRTAIAPANGIDDSGGDEPCAACSRALPLSAFSRTQQRRGDARRCSHCLTTSDSGLTAGTPLLLTEGEGDPASSEDLSADEPSVAAELCRLRKAKWLRRRLVQLCAEHQCKPTLLAFDRWVARGQLAYLHAPAHAGPGDPLIPSSGAVDPGLVSDLLRSGLAQGAASAVAEQLAAEAVRAVAQVDSAAAKAGDGSEAVNLVWRGDTARLSAADTPKPYVEISRDHWRKLAALHTRWCASLYRYRLN